MNSHPSTALMDLTARPSADQQGRSRTHLSGRWVLLMRLLWTAVAVAALALFIAGIPARRDELQRRFQGLMGLDVRQNQAGHVVLSPWWDGPAARAGILEGDILVAIDGRPLPDGGSPGPPASLYRGVAGTPVELSVRTGSRPVRRTVVSRGGDDARVLAPLGLSFAVVAAIVLAVDIGVVLVFVAVAGVIVWYRAQDWLAMLVAATCLMFVGAAAPVIALYTTQPAWHSLLDLWFAVAFAALLTFFYLFPDGRFLPRWTAALAAALVVWAPAGLLYPALYPWRMPPPLDFLVMLAWVSTGITAQLVRYRRLSDPIQRQQTKWVVFGASVAAVGLLGRLFLSRLVWPAPLGQGLLREELIVSAGGHLFEAVLPLSIGVALLRYRLWDIDLIIRRALVYGTLTAGVVGLYVLVVGSLGALLEGRGGLVTSLLATGLVAILFQPLRERLQRAVNRLLYGERDDPYAVLSRLGQNLEATLDPDAVLPAIVESVAQALKLPYVAIALRQDEGAVLAAATGTAGGDPLTLPLTYQGDEVGWLILAPRAPGERFGPADRRLLDDLAHQSGVAVHAVRLTAELRRSRERLVTAREEERRRLRRDLHDGLGPTLATFTLKLDAARNLLQRDPTAAERQLVELKGQAQSAIADIRRVVYGLRPPALDELGLVAAVRVHATQYDGLSDGIGPGRMTEGEADLRVLVEAPAPLPSLPAAVEVAAYRIAVEALTNAARHARARSCHIRFTLTDALELEITDDGRGLPADMRAGVGLTAMRERAAELGGACVVELAPTGGTRVRARLPMAAPVPPPVTDREN